MIELKLNEPLLATRQKTGTSQHGDWELISVKEENGKKTMTIWTTNAPSGVTEGGTFAIESIDSVKYGSRKGQDGKWYDDFSIRARVKPLENAAGAFSELPGGNDDFPF